MTEPDIKLPLRLTQLTAWVRILLIGGLLMSLVGFIIPTQMINDAILLHAQGELAKFYWGMIGSVVLYLFCFFWFIGSLLCLLKRVILTQSGIEFSGLFKRRCLWRDISQYSLNVDILSATLIIKTKAKKKYTINIPDQQSFDLCKEIFNKYIPRKDTEQTVAQDDLQRGI